MSSRILILLALGGCPRSGTAFSEERCTETAKALHTGTVAPSEMAYLNCNHPLARLELQQVGSAVVATCRCPGPSPTLDAGTSE